MAELAASERLNYLSKKQRAVSSRHSRQIISATNGPTHNPGQQTVIQIAGGQSATYWDFQNSYLKFTITNKSAKSSAGSDDQKAADAAIKFHSAYDLIDRIELLADGQTLSNIEEYGALVGQYQRLEVGSNWTGHIGQVLTGNHQSIKGVSKIPGENKSATFCLPLVLTPFFNVNKYIPLVGRSNIQIRITWAEVAKAYTLTGTAGTNGSNSTVTNSTVVYGPIQMVCSMVRLSGEANQMVMQNTGGIFELITSDFRLARDRFNPTNQKSLAVNCGFAFSSLDRVSFSCYSQLNERTSQAKFMAQYFGDISNYALSINGEEYPRKRIEVTPHLGNADTYEGNPAESLAESVIAHRSLSDFTHNSSVFYKSWCRGVNADTPYTDAELAGTVFMIDTEAMQPHVGETLYSGISTIGATTHLLADIAASGTADKDFDVLIFGQFTTALTLDMEGTQTWIVSV